MNKRILYALILMGVVVIVLLFNSNDRTTVDLLVADIRTMSALVFLGFTTIGVVIGALIK